MRLRYVFALSLLLLVLGAPSVSFAALGFSAVINGAQENPANVTPATGFATLVLNDAETQVSYHIEFSGLLGTETAAHFHAPACDPATNAGAIHTLPAGSPKVGVWNLTPTQVQQLKDGCVYVNIHSTFDTAGEIRGNIHRDDSVPALPTTWGRLKTFYR